MATSALIEQGWHLTEEGIAECIENGNKSAQAIIKSALDTDLRHIGDKFLPDDINRGRVDYIQGPCVLQIQKIRNVSAPKDHEESQAAPRLLKLTLTDGHNNCSGVEMETIPSVSLNTPPGTKLVFSGTIPIENGFLLLNGRNTKCIGGRVEKLLENWELKRRLAKQHRAGIISEGGPPPFVPFGQKMIKAHIRTDNFKSLDIGKEKKESEEFEMQRRATIAEAVQAKEEGKAKTFGGNKQALNDKDVAHLVEMGFGTEHACQALRQNNGNVNEAIVSLLGKSLGLGPRDGGSRGNSNNSTSGQLKTSAKLGGEKPEKYHGRERKGRKKNDDKETGNEDVAPSRPSGPATLFDFLETKIPLKEETKSHNDRKISDTKKDSSCDNRKLDVDVRQSSENRKGAGNRRNNLPPRLSGKSNSSSNPGQNHGNSSNYAGNSYSSGPGYNNSGDGGGGNNTNSLPYSSNSHSGYDAHNSGHEYSSSNNQHNQHQTRYNSGCNSNHTTNYNNSTSSVNNCGVIGNHQNYNNSHHPQSSSNFRNASPAGDSGHGSGTTHGPNHVLGNNTPSHYLQSQHRYNNNNSSTSIHNKLPAYQNYHGDTRQSGMAHNTNMRSPRNFSNNPGQIQVTQSSNYFSVNISNQQSQQQQQQQQHYANELHVRYSSYNQKDMHHQNAGSDNPNKILSRDYHNHHQKQLQQQQQQQQQQFSASMKHPRKVLSNVTDSTGNESKHFGYDGVGGGGGRTGQNYNSTSRPKSGGGEVGGGASHKKQMDMDPADYKYQDRKNSHSPSTHSHNWRKGDHCLAKYWEDKKFYPAVIESVPDLPTCVVTFIEYGNTEEVLLTDIKPIPKNWHEISKQNSNSRGKDHTGQQQGFHNTGMMQQHHHHHHHHHSGTMMPPHHQQMNSHQPQMTPTVAAVAAAAAAAAAAAQHNLTASNSQYAGEQLMMSQSQISTMEFRRRGGGSGYARRMQQQQMMIMQEKVKPTQQFYMPPAQRVMKH